MPGKPKIERKLAAIMFTDIAGYTALSAKDSTKSSELLTTQRDTLKPIVEKHGGSWMKEMGDGLLLTFDSATSAVECSIAIQVATKDIEDLNLRIGIHEGEVIKQDGDVIGDDVNVASRIEPFSAVSGVAISHKIEQAISSNSDFETKYIGKPKLKGVAQKVEVYCITSHGLPETDVSKVSAKLEEESKFNIFAITGGILTAIGIAFWIAVGVFDVSFGGKTEVPSIGILMMENLGAEDDEFWARGITEDLIIKVAGAGLIRVAPMKEILEVDIKESFEAIAKKLRVKYLLTSSIYKKADGFDLRCQLIEVKSGNSKYANKWSESIDKSPTIVGNLANNILKSLKVSSKQKIATAPTTNTEAYEYYLKAKYTLENPETREDGEIARGLIKKSIELDDELIEAKNLLGDIILFTDNNGKKAMEIYQQNLIEAEKIGNKRVLANTLSIIGSMIYSDNSKWAIEDSLSLVYLKRALQIYEELNDKEGISLAHNKLGNYFAHFQNNYELGMKYYNLSLGIREELEDKHGIASSYNNIGILHGIMGNFDKKRDYYFHALSIYEETEHKEGIAFIKWNIAFMYMWDYYDYDKGLDYMEESVSLYLEFVDVERMYAGKIGTAYLGIGDYETAQKYAEVGLQYWEENGGPSSIVWMLKINGIISIETQQFDKALTYFNRALLMLKDRNKSPAEILPVAVLTALSKKNIGENYSSNEIYKLIEEVDKVENWSWWEANLIYFRYGDYKIGFDTNYYIYLLLKEASYLETSYNEVQEQADNLEPDIKAKFLSYPIPKAIVEEWEKVK